MFKSYKKCSVFLAGCLATSCADGSSDSAMTTGATALPTNGTGETAQTASSDTTSETSSSGTEDGSSDSDGGTSTQGLTDTEGPTTDDPTDSETDATTSDAMTTDATTGGSTESDTSDGDTSDSDMTTSSDTTTDADPTDGTTTDDCPDEDICCLMDGEVPPHALLDAFLFKYTDDLMPDTVDEVKNFEPFVDDFYMAWSDENTGNELIDISNGGVIEENIEEGRAISRAAAEMSLPEGAQVLDVREDSVVIIDLGTPEPCHGVGWGWGSILFEDENLSIGELVYLYIGLCSNADVEAFFYSDQSVEICAPS